MPPRVGETTRGEAGEAGRSVDVLVVGSWVAVGRCNKGPLSTRSSLYATLPAGVRACRCPGVMFQ